jgi:hypothetical protein
VTLSAKQLRRELREAGIANAAVDAVWPQWWTPEAEGSLSAQSELVFTVARRLGLSSRALIDGSTRFVWYDETKFKNLSTISNQEQAILASFGSAVGHAILEMVSPPTSIIGRSAEELRTALLRNYAYIGLQELLTFAWSVGIPVVQLYVFPLVSKRMHAMSCASGDKQAVLLGSRYSYAARYTYLVAHELAHIALGHLPDRQALLDIGDPLIDASDDDEERTADAFAMTLLTGEPSPAILATEDEYSGAQLAEAALRTGPEVSIDPGVLVLALGHRTRRWEQSMAALKLMRASDLEPARAINALAAQQLDLDGASPTTREYLAPLLGLA